MSRSSFFSGSNTPLSCLSYCYKRIFICKLQMFILIAASMVTRWKISNQLIDLRFSSLVYLNISKIT